MSFKIALLVLTAFIGAQAQNYNITSCSSNRTDAFCGTVHTGSNQNSCCAMVYTVQRNTSSSATTNSTAPSFFCLPVDLVGTSSSGNQFTTYRHPNNSMVTIFHAFCNRTNQTEAPSCTDGDDASCKSDTRCCATETVTVGFVNSTVGAQSTSSTSRVCVAKSYTGTNTSSSAQFYANSYSCLATTEEESFASFVKISMAVLAVMGLAFF